MKNTLKLGAIIALLGTSISFATPASAVRTFNAASGAMSSAASHSGRAEGGASRTLGGGDSSSRVVHDVYVPRVTSHSPAISPAVVNNAASASSASSSPFAGSFEKATRSETKKLTTQARSEKLTLASADAEQREAAAINEKFREDKIAANERQRLKIEDDRRIFAEQKKIEADQMVRAQLDEKKLIDTKRPNDIALQRERSETDRFSTQKARDAKIAAEKRSSQQTTLLGENMSKRVIPFADKMGAETLGFGTSSTRWDGMTPGQQWRLNDGMLRTRINRGDAFLSYGQDPRRNPAYRQKFDLPRSELLRLEDRGVPYKPVSRQQIFNVMATK